jgi:hypothetical protein
LASDADALGHVLVRGRVEDRAFRRIGGGDPKIRDVESRTHGRARRDELERGVAAADARRNELDPTLDELRAIGVIIVLEGADAAYPLRIESLDRLSRHRRQPKRPAWLLLSVTPATDQTPERAMVWVSDEYRASFLRLFEDYLTKRTPKDHPRHRELVANIGRIRDAVLADLWQSAGAPPATGTHWWELWLSPTAEGLDLLRAYVEARQLQLADRALLLNERTVVWVRSTWAALQDLPFTAVPVTELRRPEFAETIEELTREEQDELAEDLVDRVTVAREQDPAVCHLDTGVRRTHALLSGSLAEGDIHSVVGSYEDRQNHGTPMAGLALYGPLETLLLSNRVVSLRHRLESVKILPDAGQHDPRAYGLVTAQAVALPEVAATRARVFCMPITATPDLPGEPSLWSASVDALAAGVDIGASDEGIALLGAPDPDGARLFVVSAGNVRDQFQADYRARCDLAPIEDPAHAWNALTVGASVGLRSAPPATSRRTVARRCSSALARGP